MAVSARWFRMPEERVHDRVGYPEPLVVTVGIAQVGKVGVWVSREIGEAVEYSIWAVSRC
jgi:hypothetical protein